MANTFIAADRTKRLGGELVYAANLLAQACDKIRDLKTAADQMNDGVTFATVEAQFGIPSGRGADLAFLLANTVTALDAAVLLTFLGEIGGVTP